MEERSPGGDTGPAYEQGLARIEFIDSKLAVSLFTNGRKDVDLVSQKIRVYDTRFKRKFALQFYSSNSSHISNEGIGKCKMDIPMNFRCRQEEQRIH